MSDMLKKAHDAWEVFVQMNTPLDIKTLAPQECCVKCVEPTSDHTKSQLSDMYNMYHDAIVNTTLVMGLPYMNHVPPPSLPITQTMYLQMLNRASYLAGCLKAGKQAGKRGREEEEETPVTKRQKPLGPLVVYTDGACPNNQNEQARAGYGVFYGEGDPRNVSARLTGKQTNNRAEMTAILTVLAEVDPGQDVEIRSDSMLCINTITKWMQAWKKRGWKKGGGKEPKNLDLVKEADRLMAARRGRTVFTHVRGHSGEPGNEAADRLAVAGAALEER